MNEGLQNKQFSLLEKFEEKIGFFSKNVFLSLLIIGIIGLLIRISFLDVEIPFNSDNFLYFRNAGDLLVGHSQKTDVVMNNGWPVFLSMFFSVLPSNNFMDYMTLQKLLTISISVLTIIPLYYLGKHFLRKPYAILCSAIFVFEPRLIQNSLFGVTEPLYLISLVTAISLFFSKKNYL